MTRSRSSLAVPLFVLGAVLLGTAWWLLQRSGCAGDLKQGFGDVEAALALEGQALMANFAGALLLVFGGSVARPSLRGGCNSVRGSHSFRSPI
jgi:hypothetical protein